MINRRPPCPLLPGILISRCSCMPLIHLRMTVAGHSNSSAHQPAPLRETKASRTSHPITFSNPLRFEHPAWLMYTSHVHGRPPWELSTSKRLGVVSNLFLIVPNEGKRLRSHDAAKSWPGWCLPLGIHDDFHLSINCVSRLRQKDAP